MAYRNENDARDLYEWECWERLAGEADDSVNERYAGESGAFNDEYDADGNYRQEDSLDDSGAVIFGPPAPYIHEDTCPF